MNKAFEKIIEGMQKIVVERQGNIGMGGELIVNLDDGIDIVQRVASEYNNGWIPCSDRLPEESFGCLVTVMDCEPSMQTDFENILPYFVGYDGERWNDADGEEIPFEVIAWQPLPEQYKEVKKDEK